MLFRSTEAAVKNFQESKKLKVDGIVGVRTCIALGLIKPAVKKPDLSGDEFIKKFGTPAKEPTEEPAKEPTEESLSRDYYDNKKLNEAKKLFNKLLKKM